MKTIILFYVFVAVLVFLILAHGENWSKMSSGDRIGFIISVVFWPVLIFKGGRQ